MDEGEIFREFCEKTNKEINDPLEYIYWRDSTEFQSYLLRWHWNRLIEQIALFLRLDKLEQWISNKLGEGNEKQQT